MTIAVSKVVPFLWFAREAEEAVRFYVSLIPNSSLDDIWTLQADSPSGPPGSVKVVEFTLGGVQFNAMQAGPMDSFNHAVSFVINCDDQAEVDRLWDALGEGGAYEACGWLKDKYGVSWQIVPTEFMEMMRTKDKARAKRVAEAMMQMVKLEIEPIRRAFEGTKAA
ncbi:VOC family protein [Mesorhizobium sp. KR9-304]|uniref:VOC family protein n=1 Tax=Mesorhizobium sp. KR9-304 TaxID=3156614 RepID=UPI0032B39F69